MYLHTFLKEKDLDPTKCGIHINQNYLDNRLENLRVVSADEQHIIKNKRVRNISLPENCEIVANDIPKYVSYSKASGEHGERFSIEIPRLHIFKKLSSSKKISLKEKLEEAKQKVEEIYTLYPDINPKKDDTLKEELNTSFNSILELSNTL
jgi:hypothetical protein